MRKSLLVLLFLGLCAPAHAIRAGNLTVENRVSFTKTDLDCSANDNAGKVTVGSDGVMVCADDVSTAGDPQSGAPTDATYITKTTNGDLSAEFALSSLSSGVLTTDGAGNLVIASNITDSAYILSSSLDSFSELNTQIADATLAKTGTLTDTKACTYDSASGAIVCTSDGGHANGANCSAGNSPLGVDGDGAVEGCYDVLTQAELIDEDTLATNSATRPPSQQSVKAYVDNQAGTSTFDKCMNIQDVSSGDDDVSMGSFSAAATIGSVWCTYDGVGSTVAQISLEDSDGNAMTHTTPTCSAWGTEPTAQNVTSGGSLVAREFFAFDVDNVPDPTTDDYTICVSYSYD